MCIDCAVNWLDHSRTFREQGVEESETLLLRRKFFYSDQNVDSRDPVQLNLLYVQVGVEHTEALVFITTWFELHRCLQTLNVNGTALGIKSPHVTPVKEKLYHL